MIEMSHARRWSDLSTGQRIAVVALSSCELVLTAASAVDLCRRPKDQIRGSKALWWPAIFVQPIGPIAYLALAPRRDRPAPARTAGRTPGPRGLHPVDSAP
ncbi:MAG TPA: PLD nuclease N-terminal domain-containing protein [Streptosporangiaceae bacterium]